MILSHEPCTHALDRYTLSAVQVLVSLDRITPEDVEAAVTFVQQQQVCDCQLVPLCHRRQQHLSFRQKCSNNEFLRENDQLNPCYARFTGEILSSCVAFTSPHRIESLECARVRFDRVG